MLAVAKDVKLGRESVPLLGRGNIWIEDSIQNKDSVGLTQQIMQQALAETQPGQLEVIVFDDALSGLSAPFEKLNNGGEALLQTYYEESDLKDVLTFLRGHVQSVNKVMQGLAPNLPSFLEEVAYPVESYKLVVISTDVSVLDDNSQNQLSVLLKAGPSAGVSFVIHSMTLGANPFLVGMCQKLSVSASSVYADSTCLLEGVWAPPDARFLIREATRVADTLAQTEMDKIDFEFVQPMHSTWSGSSAAGISFALGRFGTNIVEVTLGDELNQRHNVLVTGAVGQGKSNLISVVIHSLCERYSPHEIQLYLLDFKEGVTLQPFFDADSGEFLPHARVLGLEADREFGLSVFRHLFEVYRQRMAMFKAYGVQSIQQYREKNPTVQLPRLMVIIDEFQMMFADRDRVSDEIAELLIKGVRLFRAAGIHIRLASQTIGGNLSIMGSAGEGLFGQVPVRIALKNSLAESHATLGPRNDAAAHLRPRQAIVNLDYGNPSRNNKTSIAHADEKVLAPARRRWWRGAQGSQPPYVFEGERRRSLVADLGRLRELSRQRRPHALLGMRIEVEGNALEIPITRDPGRNIALVGGGEGAVLLASAALSLAVQAPAARFCVLDGLDIGEDGYADLAQAIAHCGAEVNYVAKADVADVVRSLHDDVVLQGTPQQRPLFVVGFGLDRCRSLPMEFQDLCRDGSGLGVHVLGWWTKLEVFRSQIGFGGESFFDTKVALRLDAGSAKQFLGDPLLEWSAQDNRALVIDSVALERPVRIVPYTVRDFSRLTVVK